MQSVIRTKINYKVIAGWVETQHHLPDGRIHMYIKKEALYPPLHLVPEAGLEPAHLSAHAPETCVTTNSTTPVCGVQRYSISMKFEKWITFPVQPAG